MRITPLFLFLSVSVSQAQMQVFDMANTTVGSTGYVRFNNYAELGEKNRQDNFDYSEVRGNCFWESDWNPAVLVLRGGQAYKIKQVKLNFYTNDIHYRDGRGTELVTQSNVKNVIFFDRSDTLKLKAVFKKIEGFKIKGMDSFAQLLVDGETQFLKRKEVRLVKSKDTMLDHPDLRFVSDTYYYIEENGRIVQLKTTNKESLLSIIKTTEQDETWLKENKNKLKNEADIMAFLTYRNSAKK
jgi:hypothetical protein